jgi:hypothetical protein
MLLEALILHKSHISGQHHESASGLVGELFRAVPLLLDPVLLSKEAEELIRENSRAEVPGAVEAGTIGVAAAQGMGADQCNHLAVIKAHAGEDIADVTLVLGGVRKTAIGSACCDIPVLTAGSPGDRWAAQLLDSASTRKSPQIGVSDPGELSLDGLEEVAGGLETGVGAVIGLRGESHGGAVAASGAGLLIIGTTCVPCETNQDLLRATKPSRLVLWSLMTTTSRNDYLRDHSCRHHSRYRRPDGQRQRRTPSGSRPG